MPIYEYQCPECGAEVEKMQKMSASPPDCESCDAGPMKKRISAPAFQFKGEGWYVTDYARKDKEKKEKTSSGSSTSSGDSSTDKKETSSSTASTSSEKKSSEKTSEKKSTPKATSSSSSD